MQDNGGSIVVEKNLVSLMPKLKRYAVYLTKDQEKASDLLQETCARVLSKKYTYNEDYGLEPWFRMIMKNLWIDQIRQSQRQVKIQGSIDDDIIIDPDYSSEANIEHRSILMQVENAIYGLSGNDRNVLKEIVINGNSYQQTADELSLPLGTVMSRFSRARTRLREKLDFAKEDLHFALLPYIFQSDFEPMDIQSLEIEFDEIEEDSDFYDRYLSDLDAQDRQPIDQRLFHQLGYRKKNSSSLKTEAYYSALLGAAIPAVALADKATGPNSEKSVVETNEDDSYLATDLLEEQSFDLANLINESSTISEATLPIPITEEQLGIDDLLTTTDKLNLDATGTIGQSPVAAEQNNDNLSPQHNLPGTTASNNNENQDQEINDTSNEGITLTGNTGHDFITGGDKDDTLKGKRGDDKIRGAKGCDKLYGGKGDDQLNGGKGDDQLNGGKGDDVLIGKAGNDILMGGKGNDTLIGGSGDDVFDFAKQTVGVDIDTIKDYSSGDVLDISDLISDNYETGDDINDYVRLFTDETGKTVLQINVNGSEDSAGFTTIAYLHGVNIMDQVLVKMDDETDVYING
ncbi:sigma-70 family RNA polymerase sigma factor [Kiloniella spongiae]|uniref:sigma-70 family RNA polymerase sigma factor n=1 Tax=Kiloniella spongiae TaxID=1489064 RepID=UPI00069B837A|nr:sigma-70 family RNA polymerase sigma factor [Kiloniella spongiae]